MRLDRSDGVIELPHAEVRHGQIKENEIKEKASAWDSSSEDKYKVVKDWIKKYHPDKFSNEEIHIRVSRAYGNGERYQKHYQFALDARNCILALLPIWKSIDKDVADALDNPSPAPELSGVGLD